jgi:hypothetical protein
MKHHVGMWTIVYIELFTKLYNCSLKNSNGFWKTWTLFDDITIYGLHTCMITL